MSHSFFDSVFFSFAISCSISLIFAAVTISEVYLLGMQLPSMLFYFASFISVFVILLLISTVLKVGFGATRGKALLLLVLLAVSFSVIYVVL